MGKDAKVYLSDKYEQKRKNKRFDKEQRQIYRLGYLNGQADLQPKITEICKNILKQRRLIALMAEEIKRADRIDNFLCKTEKRGIH